MGAGMTRGWAGARGLGLAVVLAAAAACGPPTYEKAGASALDRGRDEAECRERAKEPPDSRGVAIGAGGVMTYPDSDLDVGAYDECMRQRGYSRVH